MSVNMNIDELIDWLRKNNFDYQSTFDKLREEQFNGSIFCCASDNDLAQLDPSLRHGPKILLRTLRDKLKEITSKNEGGSKPPVSPPAPQPEDKHVAPTPTHQPVEGQSGKDSQEYKAVQSNISNITKAIRMTPSTLDDMRQKFVEKNWLDPSRQPNERELVDSILYRIERKTSEFQVFIAILRDITGLDLIADKLEGAVPTRTNTPPVTTVATSTTKPMAHPVYDEAPTIPRLKLLQWMENGSSKEFRLIDRVAKNWRELGSAGLGMEGYVLDILEDKFSLVGSCNNLLQKFLQNGSPDYDRPTWGNLIDALRKAQMNAVASTLWEILPLWHTTKNK